MKKCRAKTAFNFILQRTNVRCPDKHGSYQQAHDRFPYVVVRDTLHRLGVPFIKAERMAGECSGSATKRFDHCAKEIKEMGLWHG